MEEVHNYGEKNVIVNKEEGHKNYSAGKLFTIK